MANGPRSRPSCSAAEILTAVEQLGRERGPFAILCSQGFNLNTLKPCEQRMANGPRSRPSCSTAVRISAAEQLGRERGPFAILCSQGFNVFKLRRNAGFQ